jgi:hypothetical protein
MDCIKDAMFLKTHTVTRNVLINPSIFTFMTTMTVDEKKGHLHPYVAPINHNELSNTKTKEIMLGGPAQSSRLWDHFSCGNSPPSDSLLS